MLKRQQTTNPFVDDIYMDIDTCFIYYEFYSKKSPNQLCPVDSFQNTRTDIFSRSHVYTIPVSRHLSRL